MAEELETTLIILDPLEVETLAFADSKQSFTQRPLHYWLIAHQIRKEGSYLKLREFKILVAYLLHLWKSSVLLRSIKILALQDEKNSVLLCLF